MLVWSGVLLYFYGSGRIANYLAPDFRIFTLLGGLGLAVLGWFNILTAGQTSACCHHQHGNGDSTHSGSDDMHPVTVVLLMLTPVALAVAWTKDEYSTTALARKGLYASPASLSASFLKSDRPPLTLKEIESTHQMTDDGFLEFSLIELAFSSGDPEIQSLLEGLKVETEGRWVEEKFHNAEGTRKRLYRLLINCCAADIKAVPIVIDFGKKPTEFPEKSWVKVAGTLKFVLVDGTHHPVLDVNRADITEPPDEENLIRTP